MANELQTIAEKAELAWNWVKRFRSEPIDRLLRGLAPPSPGLGGVPDFPPASLPKPPGVSNPLAISTAKTKEYTSAVQELLDKLQQQAKESGLLGDALLQEQARFEANAAALEDYEHKLSTSTTASAALIEQVYELKKAHEANEAAVAHNKQTMEEFTERIKKEQEELEKSNDLLKDLATDISGTLASGLIDAALHADNLGEAFQGLAESIAEAALQALLFKAITTGIDAIFAPSASQTFFTDATAGKAMLPGLFHGGGIVGEGGPTRSVPAAAFAGAPRFHSGGGFGPGEHPAILKAGEGVFTPGQMAAMGGGEGVTVQVINNTGQPVRQERGRGPDGQELLRIIVGQLASDVRNRGQLGQAIEGTFGLGRSPASR